MNVTDVFKNEETPGFVALTLALDQLGPELLQWDPETIWLELDELTTGKPHPAAFNRLMAAREILNSDAFYTDLPTFIFLCNVLYNGTVSPGQFDPADAAEIAWGITEAVLIWKPEEDEPFVQDIIDYIGHVLEEEHITRPPDILGIAAPKVSWQSIATEFADDPAMFHALDQMDRERADEINTIVKQRLLQMFTMLSQLSLQEGKVPESIGRMLKNLQQQEQEDKELKPL